jgi:hypothetical protein
MAIIGADRAVVFVKNEAKNRTKIILKTPEVLKITPNVPIM